MKDLSKSYELGELLGTGSFGEVYTCKHYGTKQTYAVKIQKNTAKQTLKHEINVYRYLNSDHIANNSNSSASEKSNKHGAESKFKSYSLQFDINSETVIKKFLAKQHKIYIAKLYNAGYFPMELDSDKSDESKVEKSTNEGRKIEKRIAFVMDLFKDSVSDFIKAHKLPYKTKYLKRSLEKNKEITKNSEISDSHSKSDCNSTNKKLIEIKHVLILGCLMLDAIEGLHRKFLVHCDIKPANFVFWKDELVLIDFGLTQKISFPEKEQLLSSSEESEHIDNSNNIDNKGNKRKRRSFKGTVKYASIFAHQGRPLSFKDDVESMVYLLCSLTEKLPWSKKDRKLVLGIKKDYKPKYYLLHEILNYLRGLKVNELVDYQMVRNMFMKEMRQIGVPFDPSIFF